MNPSGSLPHPECWGTVGYLTEKEVTAFETLRATVKEAGLLEHYGDTLCLLRFLRARKFNVKKSFRMIQDDNTFRIPFRGRTFQLSDFASLLVMTDEEVVYQGGRDKEGRPVIYLRLANFFPSMVSSDEELVLFFVFYFSGLLQLAWERKREDFTVICDLKDWSFKNFSLPLTRLLINILQNYYPERLGRVFVVNMPMLFRGAWNLI